MMKLMFHDTINAFESLLDLIHCQNQWKSALSQFKTGSHCLLPTLSLLLALRRSTSAAT
jgi:hypothetical protein